MTTRLWGGIVSDPDIRDPARLYGEDDTPAPGTPEVWDHEDKEHDTGLLDSRGRPIKRMIRSPKVGFIHF